MTAIFFDDTAIVASNHDPTLTSDTLQAHLTPFNSTKELADKDYSVNTAFTIIKETFPLDQLIEC